MPRSAPKRRTASSAWSEARLPFKPNRRRRPQNSKVFELCMPGSTFRFEFCMAVVFAAACWTCLSMRENRSHAGAPIDLRSVQHDVAGHEKPQTDSDDGRYA
jgi:hypothetical protein